MKKNTSIIHSLSILLASALLFPACETEHDDFEADRFEDVELDEEEDLDEDAVDPESPLRSDIDEFVSDQESSEVDYCQALAGCIATAKSEGHPWLYDDCIDALGDYCVAQMQ